MSSRLHHKSVLIAALAVSLPPGRRLLGREGTSWPHQAVARRVQGRLARPAVHAAGLQPASADAWCAAAAGRHAARPGAQAVLGIAPDADPADRRRRGVGGRAILRRVGAAAKRRRHRRRPQHPPAGRYRDRRGRSQFRRPSPIPWCSGASRSPMATWSIRPSSRSACRKMRRRASRSPKARRRRSCARSRALSKVFSRSHCNADHRKAGGQGCRPFSWSALVCASVSGVGGRADIFEAR